MRGRPKGVSLKTLDDWRRSFERDHGKGQFDTLTNLLSGSEGYMTLEDIGQLFDVSRERARQWRNMLAGYRPGIMGQQSWRASNTKAKHQARREALPPDPRQVPLFDFIRKLGGHPEIATGTAWRALTSVVIVNGVPCRTQTCTVPFDTGAGNFYWRWPVTLTTPEDYCLLVCADPPQKLYVLPKDVAVDSYKGERRSVNFYVPIKQTGLAYNLPKIFWPELENALHLIK